MNRSIPILGRKAFLASALALFSVAAQADSTALINPGGSIDIPTAKGITTVSCAYVAVPAGPICRLKSSYNTQTQDTDWYLESSLRVGSTDERTRLSSTTTDHSFDDVVAEMRKAESDGLCMSGINAPCGVEQKLNGYGNVMWSIYVVQSKGAKTWKTRLISLDDRDEAVSKLKKLREIGVCANAFQAPASVAPAAAPVASGQLPTK